jgi:hypothetical protein
MEKKRNYLFSDHSIHKKEIKKSNNIDSSNFKTFFNKSSTRLKNHKLNNLKNLRNKTVLNHVKLNKELLKLEKISGNNPYNNSPKRISILKKNNTTFLTSTSLYKINNHRILDSNKMPQDFTKNKILKELFPNIRELFLYSNIPLMPFNSDDKNSRVIKNGRSDLKKVIYNYYSKGGSINPSNFNVFSKYISDSINKKEVTKNKSEEKNSSLFHNKYLEHIKKKKMLKLKKNNSLKRSKLTKLNSFNIDKINKIFIVKKCGNSEYDNLTVRNKDSKTKYNQLFPDINDSKNGSYYKSIKIPKNTTFSNVKNDYINNLYEKDFENNKYSYSIKTDKIKSMILRNKLEEANKEKYENHKYIDKATNTMQLNF